VATIEIDHAVLATTCAAFSQFSVCLRRASLPMRFASATAQACGRHCRGSGKRWLSSEQSWCIMHCSTKVHCSPMSRQDPNPRSSVAAAPAGGTLCVPKRVERVGLELSSISAIQSLLRQTGTLLHVTHSPWPTSRHLEPTPAPPATWPHWQYRWSALPHHQFQVALLASRASSIPAPSPPANKCDSSGRVTRYSAALPLVPPV